MKKLSEVTKITGVSRRTLQEYDKIGLISPTAKTEAGYWLYDDVAIKTIMGIQVFVEAGVERKEIKRYLTESASDMRKDLQDIIAKLEDKRKYIDGLIKMAKVYEANLNLPERTLMALANYNVNYFGENGAFLEVLQKNIGDVNDLTDEEFADYKRFYNMPLYLEAIANLQNEKPNAKVVQECVNEFYIYYIGIINEDEEHKFMENEIYNEDDVSTFVEIIKDAFMSDVEFTTDINQLSGPNGSDFILKALEVFKVVAIKGYWKSKQ